MRAKEEEWELVRERMHREIKILRRQNTESLSLKIDAGEDEGRHQTGRREGGWDSGIARPRHIHSVRQSMFYFPNEQKNNI